MNDKKSLSRQPKVAIVHDYLNQYGGGERVVEALAEIWPEAKVYTSIYDRRLMEPWLKIAPERIKTNFISRLPFANYLEKHYFFLYPLAFQNQDLEEADIIFSTSSFASKFARGKKGAIHFCYLHTVPRFLWGYDTELSRYYRRWFDKYLSPIYNILVPPFKAYLKKADYRQAQKIDFLITNSQEVKKRVEKHYHRDSTVIYPPVDTKRFEGEMKTEDFYLVVSRLGGYKKIDLAVLAFNKLGKRLKIVGEGPQMKYLKTIAAPNVELLGRLDDKSVTDLFRRCKGVIFPTYEDFGIVPVEAMAAGKGVIGYGSGGALETIVDGVTGVLFKKQTVEDLIEAVKRFETLNISASVAKKQAEKFSKEVFKKKIKEFVESKLGDF
jgi:glycosyltransferase involved in cell wall biosynthesis